MKSEAEDELLRIYFQQAAQVHILFLIFFTGGGGAEEDLYLPWGWWFRGIIFVILLCEINEKKY